MSQANAIEQTITYTIFITEGPEDGAIIRPFNGPIHIAWHPVADATHYQLWVSIPSINLSIHQNPPSPECFLSFSDYIDPAQEINGLDGTWGVRAYNYLNEQISTFQSRSFTLSDTNGGGGGGCNICCSSTLLVFFFPLFVLVFKQADK